MPPEVLKLAKKAGFSSCTKTIRHNLDYFARLIIEDIQTRAIKYSKDTDCASLENCLLNAEMQMLKNEVV